MLESKVGALNPWGLMGSKIVSGPVASTHEKEDVLKGFEVDLPVPELWRFYLKNCYFV